MNDAAISALEAMLGDRVSRSKSDLEAHGGSETHFALCPPEAVVYPHSTEEVSAILRLCNAHGCPVIGFGAGTSLEGHTSAVSGGISVDFSRMNKLIEVRPADMQAVVQPGLTREELNRELRATGLFFSVDPGANAAMGGMAATRASGTTAVRYGTMKDNVLALEVVLADGRVIRTGSGARKSSSGYDLTALMLGSEGTLGLITELTVRLHGQPEATSAGVCAFDTIEDAVSTVSAVMQAGVPMARMEFLDADVVRAVNAYSGSDIPERPHLFVEFQGSESGVAEDAGGKRSKKPAPTLPPLRFRGRLWAMWATGISTPFYWSNAAMRRNWRRPRKSARGWRNAPCDWAAPSPANTASASASALTWRRNMARAGS